MAGERQPLGFDPTPIKQEQVFLSDRELVDQARKNPEAFGQLYDKYLTRIYSYHFYRLGSPEAAEDATQETFLSAVEHFAQFEYRHEASVPAWLFRIAHNKDANEKRQLSRRPTTSLDATPEIRDNLLSPFGEPEEEFEEDESKKRIRELVLALPPQHRDMILMRFVGDLPHRVIGDVVGKTEGSIKSTINRILKKLKKQFEAHSRGPEAPDIIDDFDVD